MNELSRTVLSAFVAFPVAAASRGDSTALVAAREPVRNSRRVVMVASVSGDERRAKRLADGRRGARCLSSFLAFVDNSHLRCRMPLK
jgi:hypothetical protein